MAEFIPGPWEWNNDGVIYQKNNPTTQKIAACHMHIGYRSSDEQMHANAKLIAAAPTMLAALEAVAASVVWDSDKECAMLKPDGNIAKLVSDAIQKARGL